MKSLLGKLGVILMAVTIFYPYNSFAEIEMKYDRFNDTTIIRTKPKNIEGTITQPALVVIGRYLGHTPSRPEVCWLGFMLKSPQGAYSDCHTLLCLADGSPVRLALPALPNPQYSRKVVKGEVWESIHVTIPFGVAEQLSRCEKVEFKLCNTEFSLSSDEMEDLKAFVEAFKEKR